MSEQPPPPPPPSGWQQPPYGAGYPPPRETSSKAVIALVLGVLGFVSCGPFTSVPAIFIGRSATREIDASGGRIEGRGLAQAGFIVGLIGTILWALVIVLVICILVFGLFWATSVDTDCHRVQDGTGFHIECSGG